jgi:hypothetical protein
VAAAHKGRWQAEKIKNKLIVRGYRKEEYSSPRPIITMRWPNG